MHDGLVAHVDLWQHCVVALFLLLLGFSGGAFVAVQDPLGLDSVLVELAVGTHSSDKKRQGFLLFL